MFILQQELDETKSMWNTHYIREETNSEWLLGWPNVFLFYARVIRSFKVPVSEMDINARHSFWELPDVNSCTNETHDLVRWIMLEEELEFPSKATEAKNLFI